MHPFHGGWKLFLCLVLSILYEVHTTEKKSTQAKREGGEGEGEDQVLSSSNLAIKVSWEVVGTTTTSEHGIQVHEYFGENIQIGRTFSTQLYASPASLYVRNNVCFPTARAFKFKTRALGDLGNYKTVCDAVPSDCLVSLQMIALSTVLNRSFQLPCEIQLGTTQKTTYFLSATQLCTPDPSFTISVLQNTVRAAEEEIDAVALYAFENDAVFRFSELEHTMTSLRCLFCPIEKNDIEPSAQSAAADHETLSLKKKLAEHLRAMTRGGIKMSLVRPAHRDHSGHAAGTQQVVRCGWIVGLEEFLENFSEDEEPEEELRVDDSQDEEEMGVEEEEDVLLGGNPPSKNCVFATPQIEMDSDCQSYALKCPRDSAGDVSILQTFVATVDPILEKGMDGTRFTSFGTLHAVQTKTHVYQRVLYIVGYLLLPHTHATTLQTVQLQIFVMMMVGRTLKALQIIDFSSAALHQSGALSRSGHAFDTVFDESFLHFPFARIVDVPLDVVEYQMLLRVRGDGCYRYGFRNVHAILIDIHEPLNPDKVHTLGPAPRGKEAQKSPDKVHTLGPAPRGKEAQKSRVELPGAIHHSPKPAVASRPAKTEEAKQLKAQHRNSKIKMPLPERTPTPRTKFSQRLDHTRSNRWIDGVIVVCLFVLGILLVFVVMLIFRRIQRNRGVLAASASRPLSEADSPLCGVVDLLIEEKLHDITSTGSTPYQNIIFLHGLPGSDHMQCLHLDENAATQDTNKEGDQLPLDSF